ncbi:MAG: gluconate 2-dehydrogenase subunit 3 family protein [Candidatus Dormibacteraeota bacterium]|nr:gluconate 2-dehydrogenase subunit 3 family protein [Candidatus Dormibacteraeota bacterium]MBV9525427.1 gluconate 2-dehydrogenase subunit 3 family protein [Candidatus Dormibacteraeota bacterium]
MPRGDRYRNAEHLPNLRAGRRAPPAATLPRQRRGTTPQMVGRYPDYDVMDSAHTWDAATRRVVEARLRPRPGRRFFSDDEADTARALCDTVTAQDRDPRIPVMLMVDEKLADRRFDGYRYEDMPDDDQTWRLVLRGLDEVAQRRYGAPFARCAEDAREAICEQFSRGVLQGRVFDQLNCKRAWTVVTRAILAEFYSHPWAWNEIGFGGPAYPRGYMRLGEGLREPHARPEAVHDDPVRELTPPAP